MNRTYSPQHLHGAAAVWRLPCVEMRFTMTFLGNQNGTAYVKFEVLIIRFWQFVMNSVDPRSMEGLEIAKKSNIGPKNLLMLWLFDLIETSV